MFPFIAIIFLAAFAYFILGHLKAHERETGLPSPSRLKLAEIRDDARQRGIPEKQAYSEWVAKEQRKRSQLIWMHGLVGS